jgi:hypothetical protein
VKRTLDTTPTTGRGSIRADELVDLRTFGKRLGLGPRILCDLQRAGLRTVLLGRRKYIIGKWALEFAEQQAGDQGVANGEGGGADAL